MIKEYTKEKFVWVDITAPTREEVRALAERFELDLTVADELLEPASGAYATSGEGYVSLTLHIPSTAHSKKNTSSSELDLLLGGNWLITSHTEPLLALEEVSQIFEVESMHERGTPMNAVICASLLLGRVYRALHDELTFLKGRINKAEQNIFAGREREMVVELSEISRALLSFKQELYPHEDALLETELHIEHLFNEKTATLFSRTSDRFRSVWTELIALEDILRELRETNTALLYTKQNEIMKNLTIMAFVTFPLSLIAAIFGMNTVHTPIIGMHLDFWIIFGAMAFLTLIFFVFFKMRKWL